MSRRVVGSTLLVAALSCGRCATARADPTNGSTSYRVGWTVAALSVTAGAAITGTALIFQCPDNDLECARWTSLGIWTGIGVGSLGSIVGLLMVQKASRPSRVQVSFTVDRSRSGTSMPRATLVCVF